ncbi:hypothetical protein DL95DRAFT_428499 [Leptodontidium sp. 2 PMI_412]|nr:hypothetical protein DL95DRAFT_428499 [Leptodontidium sp. 2 PMI_412]
MTLTKGPINKQILLSARQSRPECGCTAKNRFPKAAMTERISSWDPKDFKARGIPSKNLINVYKGWGEGGYDNILTENIMIEYDQLEAMSNRIIPLEAGFSGPRFEAFKELATAAKTHGSLIVGQVSHSGLQAENRLQKNPISTSDIQLEGQVMGMEFANPHQASQEEIDGKSGYDGIQLHAAHGYPPAQLLSQSINQRTDKHAKGFSPEEAKKLCEALEKANFDFTELSGGKYESLAFEHKRESTVKTESLFIEFAEEIVTPLTKTKPYVRGGLETVGAMVKALDTVDGVGIARLTCQEPHLPRDILDRDVTGAIQMKLDDNNFGLTNVALIDLSVQENVDGFLKDMEAWGKKLGSVKEYGYIMYIDLSRAAKPYGSTWERLNL